MQKPSRSHRPVIFIVAMALVLSVAPAQGQATAHPELITADANAPSRPFPHFWEKMFGSGRAILSLRESYRRDLREVKEATDFEYVRFHAIFHDEVGVYQEDSEGRATYNFSYLDQIYDGLLANGVRPFVELSFMPSELAAKNILHAFWYKPNVSPPKDWEKWDQLITAFAKHLVERYGIDEVASWYFEVWNEPNIDFWAGEPKQATYWQLYDHTARAIKKVNTRLRVGGPATAQAAWVDAFIEHCVHEQISASPMPNLPLIWSEFNASYKNEPPVTDSIYMGPWLADTIRRCDGLVDIMAYWTFSDVFEEQGVVKTPFYGGFGLIAAGGIPKPSYHAFRLLHKVGDRRIPLNSESALLTLRSDGTVVLAVWNYASPDQPGSTRDFVVHFKNTKAQQAQVWRLDSDHGDVHSAYEKMGAPRYPTQAELQQLRSASALIAPETRELKNGELTLDVPAHGLALVELK